MCAGGHHQHSNEGEALRDGCCLHNGLEIFNIFSKEVGFYNLLHNLWKMRLVKSELLSKQPASHLVLRVTERPIGLRGCGFAVAPPRAITLHCH